MQTNDYRLIVSSGPTREWLDPARFISNPSTGQTGWHLAHSGIQDYQFKEIVYIYGACQEKYCHVEGATNIEVDSTAMMAKAVQDNISSNSILFMAAAPADYTPVKYHSGKMEKSSGENVFLELKPTVDILKSIMKEAEGFSHFIRIGFAAQTGELEKYAKIKLASKKLNFICANQVYKNQTGFGNHQNTLFVYGADGSQKIIGPVSKKILAQELLAYITGLL